MLLPFKSLVTADQITPGSLNKIFSVADSMVSISAHGGSRAILADKIIALLFLEPSSRTMLSFQSAAKRLKADYIFAQGAQSTSLKKGERLEDMMRVVSSYADLIVMRHAQSGSASIAAQSCTVPFINAGDGGNEHPTQALVDAYTIYKSVGRLDNLRISFGFDPRQSRSIRSLAILLSGYRNNYFTFISPPELSPTSDFLSTLASRGATCRSVNEISDGLDVDILYMNRLQEERFKDSAIFEYYRNKYTLTAAMISKQHQAILDPLPRIDEISRDVDQLPQAAYFRQASFGIPIRMSLLTTMLGRV